MHFFHPLDECCRYGMFYLKGNIVNDHNAYCMDWLSGLSIRIFFKR
jgi:hypothetical protein